MSLKYQFSSQGEDGKIIHFSLEIDEQEIARRLAQALRKSKTGVARVMHGAIKAKIIKDPK